jgi:hypothetical protein
MIGVVPWQQKYPSWGTAATIQLGSCSFPTSSYVGIRLPLADFKPYNELYSLRIIGNTTLQAVLTAFLPVLNDFQTFTAGGKYHAVCASPEIHITSIFLRKC